MARSARALKNATQILEPISHPKGPCTPTDWKTRYLELVREKGNFHRTAREVGVDPKTAYRERERDADFDAACMDARQEFADRIEDQMVEDSHLSGNPAGQIVRLKALRPAEYIEKHAVMSLTANLNELPVTDAVQLLKAMLGATTPATQRQLADGGV